MTIISSSQYWESIRWSRGCRGAWCRAPATGRWESAPRNRFRPAEASKDQHGEEARPECMPVIQFPDTFPIISSSCPPGVMGGGGSRRMLRHGATGMRFFRRGSWLPGAGDSRRRIYPGRCSTCFSFRSVRVGQTGGSAQQPPHQNIVFPDESAYACTHTGEKHAACVGEACAHVIRDWFRVQSYGAEIAV